VSDPQIQRNADAPDADIVDWLNEGVAPEPLDAMRAARVKHRLLQRIAQDRNEQHLTVRHDDGTWRAFGPGLTIKVLHEAAGVMSYLLRLAPGASLPPHRHPTDEECIVLEGELQIGDLRVAAGGFHLGRKDVLHARISTVDGALLYLRGATPDASLLV
jgi:hypothetical protein